MHVTRFSAVLKSTLGDLSDSEKTILGCDIQVTLYFTRTEKTFARICGIAPEKGIRGGPSAVSIHLRYGWSLGGANDRYLFGGEESDQLLGRLLALLPFTDLLTDFLAG